MVIEVGMHTGKHRIKLTLSSEDIETHSFMSDYESGFKRLAQELSQFGIDILRFHVNEEYKEKEYKEQFSTPKGKRNGKTTNTGRNPRRR